MNEYLFRVPYSKVWHIELGYDDFRQFALCNYEYDSYNCRRPEEREDKEPQSDWCKNCLRIWQKQKGETDE